MICWYCYWGWAKPVADIYNSALIALGGDESPLHYSFPHIVWADENFEDENIQSCLENIEEYRSEYSDQDVSIVKWSLKELLKIPEEIRCPEPEDYDDEHPELYPPKTETIRRGLN
jgi:hypothetical protein